MADEMTFLVQATVNNDEFRDTVEPESWQVTQNNLGGGGPGLTTVATSEGDISLPNISTLGYAYIKNCDATNYVSGGPKSAGVMVPFFRLNAGESMLFRLYPGITLRMQAHTASCKVFIKVWED